MRKLLVVGAAALALVGGSAVAVASQTPRNETFRMLELFGDIVAAVEQAYVVPVDNKKLIESALRGMMSSLDPHSDYLPPDGYGDLRERTEGQYSGVGLVITTEGGLTKVVSPMDGGPAVAAGIQAGDVISQVDGQNTAGLTNNEVSEKLRGEAGTTVRLTILRDGEDSREIELTRQVIRVDSVTGRLEGDLAYVRISSFNQNTTQELTDTLARLKRENPNIAGYVLDVRNNGGGLLSAAVAVADAFLERGEIVSQRGRKPDQIDRYSATPGDLTGGKPVVVLINYGSASASEIVAGALKDQQRATVIGLTSFGKGSVQTVFPLRGGQDGALYMTTARYYTPSGRSIQKIGIEPDLEVSRSAAEARIISRSNFIYSEAAYATALDASIGAERRGPHAAHEAPGADYPTDKDYQLERAFQLLRVGGDLSRLPAPGADIIIDGKTPEGEEPAQTETP
ncbi:MAG TPA: S41 family peptidase [Brevundimonas sp.]|uniref:S41 family peptidase n=1 Tax=Brevundimonas sp. TaxID=1871086 RepID=UPI002637461F|nr:S41 family peptidase [Brevundimonas sp.]HRO34052.1 S41 family peptidase [Brevundimonas sp.]